MVSLMAHELSHFCNVEMVLLLSLGGRMRWHGEMRTLSPLDDAAALPSGHTLVSTFACATKLDLVDV
jgi:hypothetical protein